MIANGENVFFIDTHYVVEKLSRKLIDKLGDHAKERIIGNSCFKVLFRSDSPCSNCPVSRSIAFKTVVEEDIKFGMPSGNGHVRHVVATPVTDENETVRHIIVDCLGDAFHIDVSDIRQPQKQLQRRQSASSPMESSSQLPRTRAILVDRDLTVILYNEPVKEIFPHAIQNIVGHNLFSVLSYYNQYSIRHKIEEFVKSDQQTLCFSTKADFYSPQWAEHELVKLGHKSRLDAILILSRPATSAKEEESVEHRKEKIRFLSRFASKISHEIKNPLSLISTNVEFLKSDITNPNSDDNLFSLAEYIDKVHQQVKEVISILDTVNALKVHNMDSVVETEAEQFLNRAITITLLNRPYPNNEIRAFISDDLPSFYASELSLERAFSELFKSLLHSAGTEGKLKVYLNYLKERDLFMFKIRSNDSIQALVDLENMLNEFFTSKRKFDISNLGLIIAYATILNHDGHMEIVNVDAGQAEVLIKFPRVPK